jgi:hypothetical protein
VDTSSNHKEEQVLTNAGPSQQTNETYNQKHLVQRIYKLDATDSTDLSESESKDKEMHNILKPYIRIIENLRDQIAKVTNKAKEHSSNVEQLKNLRAQMQEQGENVDQINNTLALNEIFKRVNQIFNKAREITFKDETPARPQTPHPGTKVTGYWDNEETEEQYPEDRALTPEELAIHTPPASPKLVRKNATLQEDTPAPRQERQNRKQRKTALINNRQALAIFQKDWTTFAKAEYQQVQQKHQVPITAEYLRNPRNPKHSQLS